MTHNLASGMVVVQDNKVLLVKQKHGWSLPKGSTKLGETFLTTANRHIKLMNILLSLLIIVSLYCTYQ
ncbi:NUDIX domain-containing protein [Virgibacillus kekensis]|uniref:NUDIX domain-containing protein n=1 Tax=Virgibacillus kekensis TaxID=202261 RepID=A0ABV9DRG2_9BACI